MTLNASTSTINADHFEAVHSFVMSLITDDGNPGPDPDPRYDIVLRFCIWAWDQAGLPLDAARMFKRPVVEYYVQMAAPRTSPALRELHRAALLALNRPQRTAPPHPPARNATTSPTMPYTAIELVHVLSWARAQTTPDRRRNASVLIALALGGGLQASEISELRLGQLHFNGPEVDVTIPGPRHRLVPILQTYAPLLTPPSPNQDPRSFLFRPGRHHAHSNSISNFLQRSSSQALQPQARRMRATWVVHQLNSGTPPNAIVAAGGFPSVLGLAPFLKHAEPPPDIDANRQLRYASPPRS